MSFCACKGTTFYLFCKQKPKKLRILTQNSPVFLHWDSKSIIKRTSHETYSSAIFSALFIC